MSALYVIHIVVPEAAIAKVSSDMVVIQRS